MDIEGSEWPSFATIFEENSLKNVKQLIFEVHVGESVALHQLEKVRRLETLGFRKFGVHINHYNRFVTSSGRRLTKCYELSYINTNFMRIN